MVEVFKTNVFSSKCAELLIDKIQQKFNNYKVNFDLEDCDLILRIECNYEIIDSSAIILLLFENGFLAQVLTDDYQPIINWFDFNLL